eukprot:640588-Pleurochrysis_carterae.AAC.2
MHSCLGGCVGARVHMRACTDASTHSGTHTKTHCAAARRAVAAHDALVALCHHAEAAKQLCGRAVAPHCARGSERRQNSRGKRVVRAQEGGWTEDRKRASKDGGGWGERRAMQGLKRRRKAHSR